MRLVESAFLLPVLDAAPAALVEDVDPIAARFLKLLADPTRRRVALALMRGETCNCELAEQLGLAQNLVSHHIRQLREAGLVRERRDAHDARWVYYTLDPDALERAWAALAAAFSPAVLRTRTATCGPAGASPEEAPVHG